MRIDSNALMRVFVVFVFLLASTGLLIPLLRQQGSAVSDVSAGDPVTQILWLGVYAVTFVLIALRWRQFVGVVTRDKLLLLLVALAVLSVLWSAAPETTLRRGVALVGTTAFGAYLAARYTLGGQLRLLAWALGIAAVLSLISGLALPSYGISSDPLFVGDWQGIYNHKNALGNDMSLGAVVFLILAASNRGGRRWLIWGCFVLAVCLIVLSDSQTALIVLLALLALWPVYRSLRWRYTLALPFLIFAVLLGASVATWLVSNADTVLGAFGRDVTLSGRTELWSLVWDEILERPLLGYGYSGFWLGLEGESAPIWLATGSEVPAADNGFLDLWLNLGLVGVAVFVAGFSVAFLRAAAWARASRTSEGIWPCIFLTFMLLYSVSESVFLRQNSTLWILYVSTVLSTFSRDLPRGARDAPAASAGTAPRRHREPLRVGGPRRTTGPAETSGG
jgi:exopolysaccharide production protein ExoQ